MRRTLLLLLACVLVGLADETEAQTRPRRTALDPPDTERYVRWGSLRVRPGLRLSNFGYDSNIFNTDESREPVPDYTATISPYLDALFFLGRNFVTFGADIDYNAYLENGDQNFTNYRGDARLTIPLGNFGLYTEFLYRDSRFRPIDNDDIRAQEIRKDFGGGLILLPSSKGQFELGATFRTRRVSDPDQGDTLVSIQSRLNRDELLLEADWEHLLTGRTKLLASGLLKNIDFEFPTIVLPITPDSRIVDQDSREWRLTAGLSFEEGGPLTGNFQIGWDQINADAPDREDFSDWVGRGALVYRFGLRTRLQLNGRRLPGFSVRAASTYYLETVGGARVTYYINRMVGLEGGLELGRLSFPGSEFVLPGEDVILERKDDLALWDYGVRLRLSENQIGRRIEYYVRAGRYRRVSTAPNNDRSRNTFTMGAVLGY